jgi:hypothetical protein
MLPPPPPIVIVVVIVDRGDSTSRLPFASRGALGFWKGYSHRFTSARLDTRESELAPTDRQRELHTGDLLDLLEYKYYRANIENANKFRGACGEALGFRDIPNRDSVLYREDRTALSYVQRPTTARRCH